MPGPMPKPASARQRRNRTSTAAVLTAQVDADVPELGFDVLPRTAAWWYDVWTSPMAGEFDSTDQHGLAMLAALVDSFWRVLAGDPTAGDPLKLLAEIRQQSQRYGLSPIDRRRLQWEIVRTEEAQAQTERRRSAGKAAPAPAGDPRAILRAV